ncbi:precorrin-2 C(20)-methyltransferase [Methylocapsa sp. S129]|uniref:precorrin-2 C(20)-methyltransferase n=1 Tax=Methylocapsa sp. S129 TaxID=1641869 RepID=UPI00131AF987|nr:precorrin-2 C(20)-methyltransferase [Methylocapsa sp. S129]
MSAPATGRLYGIGLGPGDPELLTVKAVRLIQAAPVVAYFAKAGRRGNARKIVDRWLVATYEELPLYYPVTTEIPFDDPRYVAELAAFYEASAKSIAAHLLAGRDVALLSEGDPLFYSSFMHLFVRLKERFPVTIVPGVTGMSGCLASAQTPITWGDDVLTILPGTLPAAALAQKLKGGDAVAIMKIGRNLAKIRAALTSAGLLDRAIYVERATMDNEIIAPLAQKIDDEAPYFAMVIVPGMGRRP